MRDLYRQQQKWQAERPQNRKIMQTSTFSFYYVYWQIASLCFDV